MRAMILAAGRGERLRPLTDATPKPLLSVGGEAPLIRHVRRLTEAGFSPLVVNLCHLGGQIKAALGDGGAFGARIAYSSEAAPLGVAGGIRQAMARGLLPEPFVVVNGDVICDYDVGEFHRARKDGAHLLLVDNPSRHPDGDFSLANGKLRRRGAKTLTYAGMGAFHPSLFAGLPPGEPRDLLSLLLRAIDDGVASGEYHGGAWHDIGAPAALAAARQAMGGGD